MRKPRKPSPIVTTPIMTSTAPSVPSPTSSAPTPTVPAPPPPPPPPDPIPPSAPPEGITVSSIAELKAALANSAPGATIFMAPGNYGNLDLRGYKFSSPVIIRPAAAPPSFNSVTLVSDEGLVFQDLNINFVPNATTYTFTPVLRIEQCKGVYWFGGRINGGLPVNGGNDTPSSPYSTVTGYPCGRISIANCTSVGIQNAEITLLDRAIVLNKNTGVLIADNNIHDTRRTHVIGGSNALTIARNRMHDIHPWHWGLSGGDHADFIALETPSGQTPFYTDIVIQDNLMWNDLRVLGGWCNRAGQVRYQGNIYSGCDNQGIMITSVAAANILDNVVFDEQPSAASKPIIIRAGCGVVNLTNNITRGVWDQTTDDSVPAVVTETGTRIIQYENSGAPGYVSDADRLDFRSRMPTDSINSLRARAVTLAE